MKKANVYRSILVIGALICLANPAAAATLRAKVVEVQSGNSVLVTNTNRPVRVRLKAIAPPEAGQPFSAVAREHLQALVFDKAVVVEYSSMTSDYLEGRVVA